MRKMSRQVAVEAAVYAGLMQVGVTELSTTVSSPDVGLQFLSAPLCSIPPFQQKFSCHFNQEIDMC